MMRLAITKADVTGPDGTTYESVTVLTVQPRRDVEDGAGKLRLLSRAGTIVLEVDATAVRQGEAKGSWVVDTTAGAFTVARKSGCGCR